MRPPPRRASLRALGALCAAVCLPLASGGGCIGWFSPGYVPPEASFPPPAVLQQNPALVPVVDRDLLWDRLVDVVDDYFKISQERRVRQEGDFLTEGTIETFPRTGSTVFEPWNKDSVTDYERLESTLQSVRRTATVRVVPAQGGFLVDVAVFKELEDVLRPEAGGASRANLRNDSSVRRYSNPLGGQQPTLGWIPLGRDVALEQEILCQLQGRVGGLGLRAPRAF